MEVAKQECLAESESVHLLCLDIYGGINEHVVFDCNDLVTETESFNIHVTTNRCWL